MYVFCIMGILFQCFNLNIIILVNFVGLVFDSLNGIQVNLICFYVLKVFLIFVLY